MRKDMLSDQSGWRDAVGETAHVFCATMQLRTPLRILLRHGEECPPGVEPPAIADEAWHGIWVPVIEGMALWGQMASEIGYIPADGGFFPSFPHSSARGHRAKRSSGHKGRAVGRSPG